MRDVILHAFHWRYAEIADNAEAIAAAGYGAVLFPPPLWSEEGGMEWWQAYQPKDYRILRSSRGRKAELVDALQKLKAAGVRALADVVFNHMANEDRPDRYDFPGKDALERYASDPTFEEDKLYGDLSKGLFTDHDFHPNRSIEDWMDPQQVVDAQLSGLPDLTLSIAVVREQIECLAALADLGFDGFRGDAIKHMPREHVAAVFHSKPTEGRLVFGETLTFSEAENAEFLWPDVDATRLSFYDFPLQQTLKRALGMGGSLTFLSDPESTGKALPDSRAITFTVTHDVANNEGFRGMVLEAQDDYLAMGYILGRDGGVPLIYSDHGESSAVYPSDQGRWNGCWNRMDVTGMIQFHNAVQGQHQRSLWVEDGVLVFARGDFGIVAINKTDDWVSPEIWTAGLQWGDYRCRIHQHLMDLQGDSFRFAIPPRDVQMWLRGG